MCLDFVELSQTFRRRLKQKKKNTKNVVRAVADRFPKLIVGNPEPEEQWFGLMELDFFSLNFSSFVVLGFSRLLILNI